MTHEQILKAQSEIREMLSRSHMYLARAASELDKAEKQVCACDEFGNRCIRHAAYERGR